MPASPEQQRAVDERRARVAALHAQGLGTDEIAEMVGLPSRHAVVVDLIRAAEAAEAERPVAEPPACGTWAAYRRHQRRGEPACEACQAAARERAAARYVPHRYVPSQAITERRARVVQLRAEGLSWAEIASRVGLSSKQAAFDDHRRAVEAAARPG